MNKNITFTLFIGFFLFIATGMLNSTFAQLGGNIVDVDAQQTNQNITVRFRSQGSIGNPEGFIMSNPNRIVLDFNNVRNATGQNVYLFNLRFLRDVQLAQAGSRMRAVINIDTRVHFEIKSSGNELFVVLKPQASVRSDVGRKYPSANLNPNTQSDIIYSQTAITDIRFRRGEKGEGKLVISLSNEEVVPDITQRGDGVLLLLKNTSTPVRLRQNLDVVDFATPVKGVSVSQEGNSARILLTAKGLWEYTSYQVNNVLIVEVVPVEYDPNKLTQGNRKEYTGEKLSLNFQNVDIRSIFQVIADFKDMNIITSDSVGGAITLRLRDVPWDQALELIMESRDLGMEKNGNIIWIAPKAEINAKRRLELEQARQLDSLQPLKTEIFKIKYHKASNVRQVLQERTTERGNNLLSGRGSAVPDERTNTLIVNDIPGKLQAVRDLLQVIDVPLPQVMIEARIVSSQNNFSETFAPKLALLRPGGTAVAPRGSFNSSLNGGFAIGGTLDGVLDQFGDACSTTTGCTPVDLTSDGFVDLLSGSNPGKIGLAIFNKSVSTILGLELNVLETQGRAKTISNPRIVTQTNKAATITTGVQIPYANATESGATTTQFVSANLSLNATPQVTPDGKVLLTVSVNDSSPGEGGQINTSNVQTEVLVENGGTLVIGGIYIQAKSKNEVRIPFFADLPLVGRMFRNTVDNDTKNEFLVFITPKILADGSVSFTN